MRATTETLSQMTNLLAVVSAPSIEHGDDPPRGGARAAAAAGAGRDHHLHRRRLEDARDLRAAGGSRAGGVGGRVPQRAPRRASSSGRGCSSSGCVDPSLSRRELAFLERFAPAFGELASEGEDALYVDGTARLFSERHRSTTPARSTSSMGLLERRVALLRVLRAALGEPGVYVRIGRENELPAMHSLALVATGYGMAAAQAGHGVGDRAGADGLRGRDRDGARGRARALALRRRRLRRELASSRCPATPTRCSASSATPPSSRSRRPSASSRGSCIPTSTPTTRTPRRSSRRRPRPTRSCPTPSGARPTTATATRACAPAATRPTSTPSARSATCSTPSSAAARRRALRGPAPGRRRRGRGRDRPARSGRTAAGVAGRLRGGRALRALPRQRRRAGHADRDVRALRRRRTAAGGHAHALRADGADGGLRRLPRRRAGAQAALPATAAGAGA